MAIISILNKTQYFHFVYTATIFYKSLKPKICLRIMGHC